MKTHIIFKQVPLLYIILIIILLSTNCNKKEGWIAAVIVDSGSPAVDGCGFLIEIGNQVYYPVNLEERYQIDKKRVKVLYVALEEIYTCGFPHSGSKFQKIDIREITEY